MSMFDTVQVVNIWDERFRHNGLNYQTKCMENLSDHYIIFNEGLYRDPPLRGDAEFIEYDGEMNIYTDHSNATGRYWIEYNLVFEKGRLVDVELLRDELREDFRDMSRNRPEPKGNRSCVTIDIRNADDAVVEDFYAELDERLDAIRQALGDSRAEIIHPVKPKAKRMDMWRIRPRMVHSVVQDLSDFQMEGEGSRIGSLESTDRHGNKIRIILDEFSTYMSDNMRLTSE